MQDFLVKRCPWLFRGALISVTVLIFAIFSISFLAVYLPMKASDELYSNLRRTYSFHFIAMAYCIFLLLALWALTKTYWVGPGYNSKLFKSVKLERIEKEEEFNNPDARTFEESKHAEEEIKQAAEADLAPGAREGLIDSAIDSEDEKGLQD
mgnify:CR=1 FL=1